MDLIDRSEVLYKFAEILPEADSLEWYEQAKPEEVKDLVDELYSIVLNVNRIDAQPVKRGKWVRMSNNAGMQCHNCKQRIRYKNGISFNYMGDYNKGFYNFCPKCGAKMEIENDG